MCLEVKNKRVYTVKDKPKVCYKVVNDIGDGHYRSIYQGEYIKFGSVTHATIMFHTGSDYREEKLKKFRFFQPIWSVEPDKWVIEHGLHGFRSMKDAARFIRHSAFCIDYKVIKMVLPVGTKYCTGVFSVNADDNYKSIVATKAIYRRIK